MTLLTGDTLKRKHHEGKHMFGFGFFLLWGEEWGEERLVDYSQCVRLRSVIFAAESNCADLSSSAMLGYATQVDGLILTAELPTERRQKK